MRLQPPACARACVRAAAGGVAGAARRGLHRAAVHARCCAAAEAAACLPRVRRAAPCHHASCKRASAFEGPRQLSQMAGAYGPRACGCCCMRACVLGPLLRTHLQMPCWRSWRPGPRRARAGAGTEAAGAEGLHRHHAHARTSQHSAAGQRVRFRWRDLAAHACCAYVQCRGNMPSTINLHALHTAAGYRLKQKH